MKMGELESGWHEGLQTVRWGIGDRAALTAVAPSKYYTSRKHIGGWLGYYGVFAIALVGVPDALVWLIGGLLYHQDWLVLVGLSFMAPAVVWKLWRVYLRLAGRWLG